MIRIQRQLLRSIRCPLPFYRIFLIIVFLSFLIGVLQLTNKCQEKWVPDYTNRDEWQQPEKIMDVLGIKTGMIIADVYAYSEESVLKVIEKSDFELVRIETFLPRESIFILRPR